MQRYTTQFKPYTGFHRYPGSKTTNKWRLNIYIIYGMKSEEKQKSQIQHTSFLLLSIRPFSFEGL